VELQGKKVEIQRRAKGPTPKYGMAAPWFRITTGEATFLQFGLSYEEFENGPGPYTTAVILMDDGQVNEIEADMIKFLEAIDG
jgi:hypothetical protein